VARSDGVVGKTFTQRSRFVNFSSIKPLLLQGKGFVFCAKAVAAKKIC